MKSLSKILTALAFFLAISLTANAQRGERKNHNPEKRAEKQTEEMVVELQLNDTQASKIKAINLDYAKKMHEVMEENKEAREAKKKIRDEINSQKTEELKAVLTAEQFKAYEALNKKRRPHRKRGPRQEK